MHQHHASVYASTLQMRQQLTVVIHRGTEQLLRTLPAACPRMELICSLFIIPTCVEGFYV